MILDSTNWTLQGSDSLSEFLPELIAGPNEGLDEGGVWVFQAPNFRHRLIPDRSPFRSEFPHLPSGLANAGSFFVTPDLDTARALIVEPLRAVPDRAFIVGAHHIPKIVGEECGWRWHKWGCYISMPDDPRQPTTEYLADEPGFSDGVYIVNVHEPLAPNQKDPR